MASQGQRDDQIPGVAVKAPHFFKIILADPLRHGKLMIPRRFVRKHGEGLSNLAFLNLPNGVEWKLELTRCDGEIWLQKGWQEFLEYYSVKPGHFLVFRYEGNSRFHVLIFDMSATEIDYPTHSSQVKGGNFGEKLQVSPKEESENDSSVEILDSFRTYSKRREKLPCDPRPQKMKRTNPSAKAEKISNLPKWVPHSTPNRTQSKEVKPKKLKAEGNLHPTKQEFEGVEGISTKEVGCPKSEVLTRTRPLTLIEKARALKKASGFKRRNPYFMVVMQPSYVQFGWCLNVPLKFAKTYLNMTLGDVVLRVSDGRNWFVKYSAGKFFCWKEFSLDNNLKVGDVCAFELIKGIKVSFKVVIFRAHEGQCPLSPGGLYFSSKGEGGSIPKSPMCFQSHIFRSKKRTATEKARALERAIAFNSQNPFFMVSMGTLYANGACNLRIPCKFAEKYLSDQKCGNVILLVSGGKTWPVQYIYREFGSRRNTELAIGWRAYARDNKLKEGDICVFELMEGIGVTNSHQSLGKRSDCTSISKQKILKLYQKEFSRVVMLERVGDKSWVVKFELQPQVK
ncbi:hypothetical protein I3843_01G024200 [Carya illinoinensis]|nr:B3 domain-containing transcription factor VRN1-like isoform X1 [Carya illinoinensis]KAG7993801.1 hypothetical protein I3843_01G024200 [Carya illinoinensis]